MKQLVKAFVRKLGYDIRSIDTDTGPSISATPLLTSARVTHVDDLVERAASIPGMLTAESGKLLYSLCYMQSVVGSVVEIGSWQGYSTSFLAQAVVDSGNGRFYAIDHFQGNVGKEARYVVGKADLSDLREKFEANMRRLGLWGRMALLDMPNSEAVSRLEAVPIRFLFIDGDHTREGVDRDISLFFPLLVPGAIVVFDDFSEAFPGVVGAVDDLVRRQPPARIYSYRNTLVVSV